MSTGPRSNTDTRLIGRAGSRRLLPVVLALAVLAVAGQALSFDLFTLWQQRDLTLRMAAGDWAEYRSVSIEQARRRTALSRLQCVAVDDAGWHLEVVALQETDGRIELVAGFGWSFVVTPGISGRQGQLMDHVRDVMRWEDGHGRRIDEQEWREDPLLQTALSGGFEPDERATGDKTTRAVAGRDLLCDSLVYSQLQTETIDLPQGLLIQDFTREISIAHHVSVPFLGLVFAAERAVTDSRFDPPGRRNPPPPQIRIETMELLDFGSDAVTVFGGGG